MRGSRVLIAAVVLVAVIVVAVVYVFYFPSSKGQSTTSSFVSTPANLFASTGQLPASYCSQQTYSNSSLAINWGNLAPATEGIQYVCLKNTGTTAITLAVSSSLSSSIGRVTTPQAGTILNGGGIEMIELDLWLSSSVQTGPIPSFTITVGGNS